MSISVCMATYNGERYVSEQIQSILTQLGPNDELLISDDLSTDSTLKKVRIFERDARVRLIGSSRAGGVVRNFERVLSFATGDIIILSDQDDVWLPGKIEIVKQSLQCADLVMLNGFVVDAQLKESGQYISDVVRPRVGLVRNLYKNSYVGCCMAFRSNLLKYVMPFPSNVVWHDWLIALAGEGKFRCVRSPEPSILYRRHGGNHSPTGEAGRTISFGVIAMRAKMVLALSTVVLRGFWRRFRGVL